MRVTDPVLDSRLASIRASLHLSGVPLTPQEFEAKYPLIIGWIQQTLAAHSSETRAIASLGFLRLPQYFSQQFLESAKVVYVESVPMPPLSKIGLTQFSEFENMAADGITYLDTFFVRHERQLDEALHFHELVHLVQWKLLGPKPFVSAYAQGLAQFGYRQSPLEVMAYDAQAAFTESAQPFDVEKLVMQKIADVAGR
jgi:hypothetical protein